MYKLTMFFCCLCTFLQAEEQNLIIIRHGQATNNIDNIYNSNPESQNYKPANLTEKGKKEAVKIAKKLKSKGFNNENIAVVLISPLPRVTETAEVLVQENVVSPDKIKIDSRLIDQQAGDLEGKPIFNFWKRSYSEEYHAESEESVKKRIDEFYKSILKDYPNGNIIVITHSMPAQLLMQQLTGRPHKLSTGELKVLPLKEK